MHKITKDHARSDLGEFREMLVSMLKTYSSELDVCSNAVNIMYYDIRNMSYEKKRVKVRGSFVQECPKSISKNSIIDISPAGSCEGTSHRHVRGSDQFLLTTTHQQVSAQNAVSMLQHRRKHQALRYTSKRSRRGGRNGLNLASSNQFSSKGIGDAGVRRVGMLSEAQNVGGL
jgi:hypothetical protein